MIRKALRSNGTAEKCFYGLVKGKGKVEDELYNDGKQRQLKRQRAEIEAVKREINENSQKANDMTSQKTKNMLLTRFEKDLEEVYQQFEIDDKQEISEVTMTEIMLLMGFVQKSDNTELDSI